MILVDTSVWVDHLRSCDDVLAGLLDAGMVLTHPFVIGEIALGNMREREIVLTAMSDLPGATIATEAEVLHFIHRHRLYGRGIGYVDAHLLAAAAMTPGSLWTNDKRLNAIAGQLELAIAPMQRNG